MTNEGGGGPVEVRIDSLEDFRSSLDHRHAAARTVLDKLRTIRDDAPAFGTFPDGTTLSTKHGTVRGDLTDRARKVLRAIEAAQEATDAIITNYRTVEARNRASAQDVAGQLHGVGSALGGKD